MNDKQVSKKQPQG